MQAREILEIFRKEFGLIEDKFCIYNLSLSEARESKADHVWKPGVYVFWKPTQVVKVGRHLENVRKRAFEHIQDDTGKRMRQLDGNPDARVVLFCLKEPSDRHWAAAVEIFLEHALTPEIRSKRS